MQRFLLENETIILFAQGLVFFSLGFSVWLQRRRATRLRLTQSLSWLAAFAFVEALAVWGYVFVPIQEGYLQEGAIDVLLVIRGLLQTVAFLFLFQFGLRLMTNSRRAKVQWRIATTALWLAILLGTAIVAGRQGWDVGQWERSAEALSRHLLLFPAALLSSVGLWRQRQELADVGLIGIRPYAAAMAAALVVYAVVAGIVVDHIFWRSELPTTDATRFGVFGIQLAVVRGMVGFVLAVLAVKLLEIFELEAKGQLEAVERARAVAEERARFGRDLHDGTIQSLYAAGLHLESVAMTSAEPSTRQQVREVVDGLNATIGGIREYISDLRQPSGNAQLLTVALQELARRFGETTGVDVRFRAHGLADAGLLPGEAQIHLEQVLREALSNAARHGGARHIEVELLFAPDELDLIVEDDGRGIADELPRTGEGLRNMQERARRLGGRTVIERAAVGGTRVSVEIPLDDEAPDETGMQRQEVVR